MNTPLSECQVGLKGLWRRVGSKHFPRSKVAQVLILATLRSSSKDLIA